MERGKGIILLIAGFVILLGFLGWRLEFNTPFLPYGAYLLIGAGLLCALIFGKIIARIFFFGFFVCASAVLIGILFVKETGWRDVKEFVLGAVICLIAGTILHTIGSETIERYVDEKEAHAVSDIVCAKCEQYLGIASEFESPCPRCGSNRYKYDA